MPDFKEELLQFIWKHRLLKPLPLSTVAGHEVSIISQGELNSHSGPDFSNARIRLNGLVLCGNIEIHLRSSDWLRHQHQSDRAYDHIILHVVYEHDREIPQNTTHGVEVLELKAYIDPGTLVKYESISRNPAQIPCSAQLPDVEEIKYISWLERMTVERLEHKTARIASYFENYRADFAQTFYCLLMRNLGFHTNAAPFEILARHLPVHLLLRHADDRSQLEALLLGMAGMLEEELEDQHLRRLQNDFEFMRRKYNLLPLKKEIFKFSRMRPANFPSVRLVQLAAVMHAHRALFTAPHHFRSYQQVLEVFTAEVSPYWQKRWSDHGQSAGFIGRQSVENLMTNTFAPFFFFYAGKVSQHEYRHAAIDMLNRCAAENNVRTRLFDVKSKLHINAASSQGLLNLYEQYCSQRKCLHCGIAAAILKRA